MSTSGIGGIAGLSLALGVALAGSPPDDLASQDARRVAELERAIEGCPGWFVGSSDRYVAISNADRRFVDRALTRLEHARNRFEAEFPPAEPIPLCVVRLCKSEESYRQCGGPWGSTSHWNAAAEEVVAFDPRAESEAESFRGLIGSAFHQYVHFACGEASPHPWFDLGQAELASEEEVRGDDVAKPPRGGWVEPLVEAAQSGKLVPIERLLRAETSDFLGNADTLYPAESWALTRFFRFEPIDLRWKEIPRIYYMTFRDAMRAPREKGIEARRADAKARDLALSRALEGVDLAALDRAIARYVIGLAH